MKLLIAESRDFSASALALLREHFELTLADLDRAGLLREVAAAGVLWVRLRHRVDGEVMDASPLLRAVVTNTTGLNHIDTDEAARRGIRVVSLRGETHFLRDVRATAEFTLGLMFALLRQIPAAAAHAQRARWDRDLFRGREVFGKTAVVVGYGRLGRIVSRYLRAMDVTVIAVDPAEDAAAAAAADGIVILPLEEALVRADIVTLHAKLDPSTVHLIGARQLGLMRAGGWLVNTARGELLDEAALLAALNSGQIRGAAIDVLCAEHGVVQKENPLIRYAASHDNLLLTPHIGGNTRESTEKTEIHLAQQLVDLLPVLDAQHAGGCP